MTYKIFDENSYITEFSAKVISCKKTDDDYVAVLSRTAFFPEEGGQCCDKGIIGGIEVLYVEIKNGIIYHHLREKLEVDTEVFGKIDWDLRFRNMQNHTAEHIVSGLVHTLFGYENVGFHLGEFEVTADYDHVLSREELERIEFLANKAVYENVDIKAWYPSADELKTISYRSKIDIKENLRIVQIEGYDVCACCAPHVKKSGEIGIIKLVSSENLRGGCRVRILCASDALSDYSLKSKQVLNISNLLCSKQYEIDSAVLRLKNENDNLKLKNAELCKKIANFKSETIRETDGNIVIIENDLDFEFHRIILNNCKSRCNIVCILSGNDDIGYKYIIGSEKVPLREKVKEINTVLNGRGGGTDEMIRGNFLTTEEKIREYFN